MIRAMLWDIDNTLLNFDIAEKEALRIGFKEFGLGEFTDEMLDVYMTINKRRWQALERGEMEKQEVLEGRFSEFFSLYGKATNIVADFNDRYQELLGETICFRDDSFEIVKSLKGKVLLCIASNGTKKAQTGKLKNSGFDKLFDLFFISEEIGAEKPSKKFFDVCIDGVDKWLIENEMTLSYSHRKYLGRINRNEIIMIGDSLTSDMKGANNAGIRSCWYNPDRHPVNQDVSVDMDITDLHEVMKCL